MTLVLSLRLLLEEHIELRILRSHCGGVGDNIFAIFIMHLCIAKGYCLTPMVRGLSSLVERIFDRTGIIVIKHFRF